VWGGEEQEEEADEWQKEADEWQEEAYQNSYWKVNHKGTMVLVRDRKGIY
jgi:hypothetical protein